MKPKMVIYECENCGKHFYRNVAHVAVDDGVECHVFVEKLLDNENQPEEFPMCPCLGGNEEYGVDLELDN
jgi:hypothetical protein